MPSAGRSGHFGVERAGDHAVRALYDGDQRAAPFFAALRLTHEYEIAVEGRLVWHVQVKIAASVKRPGKGRCVHLGTGAAKHKAQHGRIGVAVALYAKYLSLFSQFVKRFTHLAGVSLRALPDLAYRKRTPCLCENAEYIV